MVRQYTWKDQYDYSDNPTFQDDDEFLRTHVDHCIDALRIRLMCYADVTPFLHVIEPGAELGATPDFNTQHRCKNFDNVQQWARDNHARAADGQNVAGGHDHH
ncbi:Cyclochlorotine biosynthesis O [Hyphodiscus hymeniophilus]|uniref:Cyclochlorotine biosynthesis O n=1 Tax=Hyphodiscus hymeniophilus TaxID=353542 RepID=A0A9P7AUI6_9HELO|nr:Cyclochlorotine biosynthesis O [Hyphodiscus hymeniophilus]